jgi:hypothetical protein
MKNPHVTPQVTDRLTALHQSTQSSLANRRAVSHRETAVKALICDIVNQVLKSSPSVSWFAPGCRSCQKKKLRRKIK